MGAKALLQLRQGGQIEVGCQRLKTEQQPQRENHEHCRFRSILRLLIKGLSGIWFCVQGRRSRHSQTDYQKLSIDPYADETVCDDVAQRGFRPNSSCSAWRYWARALDWVL